jgi:hypothetical protein
VGKFVGKDFGSDCRHCSHLQISVRFVLASGAPLKGESDANSLTIALISAGVRFEPNHGSRSVSGSTAETRPRSEEARSNGRAVQE